MRILDQKLHRWFSEAYQQIETDPDEPTGFLDVFEFLPLQVMTNHKRAFGKNYLKTSDLFLSRLEEEELLEHLCRAWWLRRVATLEQLKNYQELMASLD